MKLLIYLAIGAVIGLTFSVINHELSKFDYEAVIAKQKPPELLKDDELRFLQIMFASPELSSDKTLAAYDSAINQEYCERFIKLNCI